MVFICTALSWDEYLWVLGYVGYVFGHGRFLPAWHTIRCPSYFPIAGPLELRQCSSESAARKRRPVVLDLVCRAHQRPSPVGEGPDIVPGRATNRIQTCALVPSGRLCPTEASASNDMSRIAFGSQPGVQIYDQPCYSCYFCLVPFYRELRSESGSDPIRNRAGDLFLSRLLTGVWWDASGNPML